MADLISTWPQSATVYWLGANRRTPTSGWSWVEQSPFIFTNWAIYDPVQRCAVLIKDLDSRWTTNECESAQNDIRLNYICKKPNIDAVMSTTSPTSTRPGVTLGCESGWADFDGSCYLLSNSASDHVAFNDAQAQCRLVGADLAEIYTDRENQFVVSLLRTRIHGAARKLGCPAGWTMRDNLCYLFVANATNSWTAAQSHCARLGGYVAAIKSQDQQNFMTAFVQNGNLF